MYAPHTWLMGKGLCKVDTVELLGGAEYLIWGREYSYPEFLQHNLPWHNFFQVSMVLPVQTQNPLVIPTTKHMKYFNI